MDMNRLNKGEQIFLVSSGLLFILGWIKAWATISAGPFSESGNAWQSYGFLGKLVVLLALAGLVLGILKATGQKIDLPAVAYVGIGGVATLLMLFMLLTGPADEGLGGALGIDVSRGFLLFVGIILGAAMTYGGYLAMSGSTDTGPATPPPTTGV